jgi:hypothetical protein
MKFVLLAVLFALFTGLGALIGSIFGFAGTGALIGLAIPTIWCVAAALFFTAGFGFLNALFKADR